MADNKFSKVGTTQADSKLYAIECLKKLKYLDYEVITPQMREAAKIKYSDQVNENNN